MGDGMLSREELLKRAAVPAGRGWLRASGVGRAGAAIDALDAEKRPAAGARLGPGARSASGLLGAVRRRNSPGQPPRVRRP